MGFFGLFGPPDVAALARRGDSKGLLKALAYPKDRAIRAAAATALGARRDPTAAEALARCAREDDDTGVRAEAALALHAAGDARGVGVLRGMLSMEDVGVRRAAAEAASRDADGFLDLLLHALLDEDDSVRKGAAAAVATLHGKRADLGLAAIVEAGKSLYFLGRVSDKRLVPGAQARLGSGSSAVRKAAVATLAANASPELAPDLRRAASDPDAEVVQEAIRGLATLREIDALLALLGSPRDAVRGDVAFQLRRCKDVRAVGPLVSLLEDPSATVVELAASSLGELGDPGALEALRARLADPRPPVRGAAAEALGALGDAASVDAIIALCADPVEPKEVRELAAEGLALLGERTGDPVAVAVGATEGRFERLAGIDDPRVRAPFSAFRARCVTGPVSNSDERVQFKSYVCPEGAVYVFHKASGQESRPFFELARRIGNLAGRPLAIAEWEDDSIGVVTVFGGQGTLGRFQEEWSRWRDAVVATLVAEGIDERRIRASFNVTNVARPGQVIVDLGPFNQWRARLEGGEFRFVRAAKEE